MAGLLRAWRPNVLLRNLEVPHRAGAALLAELTADPATAGIPVVVLSAAPAPLPAALAAPAAAGLRKPVGTVMATRW